MKYQQAKREKSSSIMMDITIGEQKVSRQAISEVYVRFYRSMKKALFNSLFLKQI